MQIYGEIDGYVPCNISVYWSASTHIETKKKMPMELWVVHAVVNAWGDWLISASWNPKDRSRNLKAMSGSDGRSCRSTDTHPKSSAWTPINRSPVHIQKQNTFRCDTLNGTTIPTCQHTYIHACNWYAKNTHGCKYNYIKKWMNIFTIQKICM